MFLFGVGTLTLITDLTPVFVSSVITYGAPACIAVFALYATRLNARRRAADSGVA